MPINYEAKKTLIKGLVQKMKSFRGNWEQNDPTADDYIKNKPFYTEIKESEVYALPRKNYGFIVGDYAAGYEGTNGNDIFTAGKTYMVEIDGVVSELKCKSVTANGMTWKYFGSLCIIEMAMNNVDRVAAAAVMMEFFGVEDSGENFCIISDPTSGMFFIGFEDISTEIHSVAVYSIEDVESIHKIDNKYLPDMNYISYNGRQNLTYKQQKTALSNIDEAFYDGVTQIANGYYVNYRAQQWLGDSEKEFARNNIDAISENDVYSDGRVYHYKWNRTPSYNGHDFVMRGNYFYYKIADLPGTTINYGILDCNVIMSDGTTYTNWMAGTNCYVLGGDSMCAIIVKNPGEIITHSIDNTRYGGTVESSGIYGLSRSSLHVSELSVTFKIPKSGIRVNDANGVENTITVETDGCISDSCISENIARKTDILSPDWNQNDETELDYIKNRTHWSEPEYETIVPLQTTTGQHPIIELGTFYGGDSFDFPEDAVFVIDGISYEVSSWYNDGEKFYGDSRLGTWAEGAFVNQNSHPEDVPFCAVFTWYDENIGGVYWGGGSVYQLYLYFPEDREYIVEVKKRVGTVYHKLDVNYLPIDDIYNSIMNRIPNAEEASF